MKYLSGILAMACFFLTPSLGWGALTQIGTATYNGEIYNLIWDSDNNGQSVIWLDYTNSAATYQEQAAWAASLTLTDIDTPGWEITWQEDTWRLPQATDGAHLVGYDGATTAGYLITNSEMGYLYYSELDNKALLNGPYTLNPDFDNSLNTSVFEHLRAGYYWTGTANEISADSENLVWYFSTLGGYQSASDGGTRYNGIALRSAVVVTAVSDVPLPSAVWLMATGFIALGARNRN